MPLLSHLRHVHQHNVATFRSAPLSELSGSLGDLGTLLPLMIALTVQHSISLPSTLVFSGLANILTGIFFGIPLPVQPMKAIAAIAISQNLTREDVSAAGLTMGFAVLILSITGLLGWLHRVVPVAVVKGIQVGAGLSLVISAGTSLIKPLAWTFPTLDNRLWAIATFIFLLIASIYRQVPYALLVFAFGLVLAAAAIHPPSSPSLHSAFWYPHFAIPSSSAWKTGAIEAALPQLPLTTLNSVLAVTSLAASLFPNTPATPSTTHIGLSVAIFNLIGCWFGAMPICHGSGGLAAQYRFGARSGSSIIILGIIKLLLGLFAGEAIIPLLQRFPKGLLGIMVLAAGVELAKVGQSVGDATDLWEQAEEDVNGTCIITSEEKEAVEKERGERWIVMLITVAGCLAFKNDAVGFAAGLVWFWGLKTPALLERWYYGRGEISIGRERSEDDGFHGERRDDRIERRV
ncbi:related to sulfate transporter [Ramularia collo-cygni]|uniref:Related to sulfate transporter n=1 Tax=Ramularia collo-cygni TaxID=112498 RepID=A0A2D3VF03_9PEZI|nr:related to sulfate transporter [Ramularia collo-cygni]CZT25825.1 related to sulfate transporter [Ramularia collo-cygni]